MKYVLRAKKWSLTGTIGLPASKSISNRVLIIRALSKPSFQIKNISSADDTQVLDRILKSKSINHDIGPAGTAMRFLTALFSTQPGVRILSGNARMKLRPIAPLVDALRQLGAHIDYLEKEGFPPLKIVGRKLRGGEATIRGDISSQYLSALMLIGPTLEGGLTINIKGDPLSRPYLVMTAKIMAHFGVEAQIEDRSIHVPQGNYVSKAFTVEPDWSAVVFWLSFAALSKKANLFFRGLTADSDQGDKAAIELYRQFGVESEFEEHGMRIRKTSIAKKEISWNFRNFPDLVPAATVTAAALGIKVHFTGLDNLRLKETDRIEALRVELEKVGVEIVPKGSTLSLEPTPLTEPTEAFDSHDDHRMAMALAPLSLRLSELTIQNPMVVSKSYPSFWKEVSKFVDARGRH